jgi:hypothetical protein
MFVSPKLVFLELHKTACTHIRGLLAEVVGGELDGKHNLATPDLFQPGRAFFGSVRDPWEWYVSLWAFGCDGEGDVYDALTDERRFRGWGWKSHPVRAAGAAMVQARRRPKTWRRLYADVDDARAFRTWLRGVLKSETAHELPLRYGTPSLLRFAGLLTYRYVYLFCHPDATRRRLKKVRGLDALMEFALENCFITHFIRTENLEDDLIGALTSVGLEPSAQARQAILGAGKTNQSSRKHSAAYYYTPETAKLVMNRDRLIVETFGYQTPV